MTEIHQTLKFGDLPIGTNFSHPIHQDAYTKRPPDQNLVAGWFNAKAINKDTRPYYMLVSDNAIVTLTSSLDFYSIGLYALFAYDQKVYTKIARNRARRGTNVKYFEPDDSVAPL